ncbi:MAG: hypothetical protein H0U73_12170 [Tatlockia sp.]|nr:hypothetical protein [Tatlockia sp.]
MSFFCESEMGIFHKAVKNFKDALKSQSEETSYLSNGNITPTEISVRNRVEVTGKNFVISIQELMSAESRTNYKFWAYFLTAATNVIITPHQDNKSRLFYFNNKLKLEWENGKPWNKMLAGVKIVASTFFITAGTSGLVLSSMSLHWIIWGSLGLAMGPWGAVALCVGVAILSSVVACIAAYQLYKNIKICADTPIKQINDFVVLISGDLLNNVQNPQNLSEVSCSKSRDESEREFSLSNDFSSTSSFTPRSASGS